MTPFRFADEAVLYAQHAEVVEEIRRRFETNLRAFFDHVAESLSQREWPCKLTYVVNGGSAYFWLSREPAPDATNEPAAWCCWRDAGIVRDQGVMMSVAWAKGSSEQRARIAALAGHATLAESVTKTRTTAWTIFDIWIGWSPDDDPVSVMVEALDPLLRLLDGARGVL